jgi:hypothetical protein
LRVKITFVTISVLGIVAIRWLYAIAWISPTTQRVGQLGFAGLVLATGGYLIKYRRQYDLIAGYDAERDGAPVYEANLIGGGP